MAAVHVAPVNDEREHVLEGLDSPCWCGPEVQYLDPETGLPWPNGNVLVIHNAADCREVVEEAERLARGELL